MSGRFLLGVVPSILFAAASVDTAHGQAVGQAIEEPTRFAFVVGESDYQSNTGPGGLSNVRTACQEAFDFRQSLIALKVDPNNIFPHVSLAAGATATDQDIRDRICNLDNQSLEAQLEAFVHLLQKEGHQYGIIYYAGHGAANQGEQYIFGTNTDIDYDDEIKRLKDSDEYKIFDGNSVNLTQTISHVNGLSGRALLVIVDACRNNPVIDQYNDRLNREWPDLSPAQRAKLSIGYVSPDPGPKVNYDSIFRTIMVLFSTASHDTASDAPAGDTTHFSQEVRQYLSRDDEARADAATFVNDFKTDTKNQEFRLPPNLRQIPESIGSIGRKPVFCIRGCPQPIGWFSNETVEDIPAPKMPRAASPATNMPVLQPTHSQASQLQSSHEWSAWAVPMPGARARFETADFISLARQSLTDRTRLDARERHRNVVQMAELQMPSIVKQKIASDDRPAAASSLAAALADRPVGMNIDVFHCSGDSQEEARTRQARQLALRLRASLPQSATIAGYYLDVLRLRSLDLADNFGHALRKSGNSVWIDPSDPVEVAWGKYLNTTDGELQIKHTGIPTKNYISIFFCSGVDLTKPPQFVYTQVPEKSDISEASQYIAQVQSAHRDIWFEPRIQAVDNLGPNPPQVPEKPQVRYLLSTQKKVAQRIAKELSTALSEDVSVLRITSKETKADKNPPMEVWFGREDSARWSAGNTELGVISPPKP